MLYLINSEVRTTTLIFFIYSWCPQMLQHKKQLLFLIRVWQTSDKTRDENSCTLCSIYSFASALFTWIQNLIREITRRRMSRFAKNNIASLDQEVFKMPIARVWEKYVWPFLVISLASVADRGSRLFTLWLHLTLLKLFAKFLLIWSIAEWSLLQVICLCYSDIYITADNGSHSIWWKQYARMKKLITAFVEILWTISNKRKLTGVSREDFPQITPVRLGCLEDNQALSFWHFCRFDSKSLG